MSGKSRTGVVPLPACNTDGVGMSCNRDKAAARQRLLCTSRPTALHVPHVLLHVRARSRQGPPPRSAALVGVRSAGLSPHALRHLPRPVVTPGTHAGVRQEQEERARLASAVVQQA